MNSRTARSLWLGLALLPCVAMAAADFSGVWVATGDTRLLKTAKGEAPPLNEAGRALYERNLSAQGQAEDPVNRCIPPGLPRIEAMTPFRILQDQDMVVFVYEWNHMFRLVWMDDVHETRDDVAYLGDNIGWWQDGALVIEVTRLNDATRLDPALPHSESLRLTQRYRLGEDGRSLLLETTVEDPVYYRHPWNAKLTFRKLPGAELEEDVCADRIDIFK